MILISLFLSLSRSTASSHLQTLAASHPLPLLIMEWRTLDILLKKHLASLPQYAVASTAEQRTDVRVNALVSVSFFLWPFLFHSLNIAVILSTLLSFSLLSSLFLSFIFFLVSKQSLYCSVSS